MDLMSSTLQNRFFSLAGLLIGVLGCYWAFNGFDYQEFKTHFSLMRSSGIYKEFIRGVTTFSSIPLYISLYVGFLVSSGAFIYILIIIIQKIFFGNPTTGWASMMVTLLFLGGSILFSIGIIGIYLGKMHEAMKQRPRYLIESKIGFSDDITKQN